MFSLDTTRRKDGKEQRHPSELRDRSIELQRVLYWCGIALIGAAVLAGLIEPLATLRRFVPLDPNEGWNALFGQIAVHRGNLYPDPGSAIVNNYPPLSFYIVGALGEWLGDNIFAGRAVALASESIVVANVFWWLRTTGSTVAIAVLGAAMCAGLGVTYGHAYVAINDPQWLAHAIMTTGMVVIWRSGANPRAIAAAALIMLAAGLTKHLLIPIPIATTWWLMRRSRRALGAWIVCSGLLLAAIGLLLWWRYGAAIFQGLLSARQYSAHQALGATQRVLRCFAPMIALSLGLFAIALRNEPREFVAVYVLAAGAVGAAASGGVGVDINAFFDLIIAVSLATALTIEAVWSRRAPAIRPAIEWGPALTLLLGAYLWVYAARYVPETLRDLRGLDALERDTLAVVHLVESEGRGRAACETPEFCYWGKSRFEFDFFNYGQRLKTGRQPASDCALVLDGKRVRLVQVDARDGRGSPQLPKECNEAIRKNYRPALATRFGVMLVSAEPTT